MTQDKIIPKAAAPLSKPSDGIVGLFHAGILWDGVDHRVHLTLPMKFEPVAGNLGKITVITDVEVRNSPDFSDYWTLIDNLANEHIELRKLFDLKLDRLNVSEDVDRRLTDFRRLLNLGELKRLDSLRLITEAKMMNHFNARYGGERRITHKVLGFGPVTLPATMIYQEDDKGSELLIRQVNNLSKVEASIARVYFAKYVWSALTRLFKLNSFGPLVWLYLNSVSLGLQKEGGASTEGTQLLIARLLDRINMSPYDFANTDISGYMASIMMLYAAYNLSADTLTPDNWLASFPIQVLHDFTPANATEHYNGQVDLLSISGWKREGGSLAISACPFADADKISGPGIYPITTSSNPDAKHHVSVPLGWGGENMKQDGTLIPSIPADFDRMFGWFHDPQAQGVMLDLRSIMPWKLLAAPPKDKLYSPMDFWNLYFYTVESTGISMMDESFHPMQWFVGFDSILPGNGFPIVIDASDLSVSVKSYAGKVRQEHLLSWMADNPFNLIREAVKK